MSDPKQPIERNRIVGIRLFESIPFATESMSVQVGPTGADSITPARLDPDGRAVPIEKGQACAGFLLTRRYHDRLSNKVAMERVFVPLAQVRCVIYGE